MKVCSVCHESHESSIACTGEPFDERDEVQRLADDSVPGFRLNGLLTSSHSTRIYDAHEIGSGRSCLIRIVTSDDAGAKDVLREAKLGTGLFHPGIADIYQAGQLGDGRSFVVSEAISGRTLREVLDNVGSPDLLTTIEIVRQAAEALHALHLAGLIHGAINPRNIVLSMCSDGPPTVRIQHPDFGRFGQRSIISNRFLIDSEIDSLRYFAPEQCSGDGASSQSDIYSLGVVFYEMLSGVPPFDAQSAVALIHQQRNQQPPEVRIENFNLRMLVTHALSEALQKHARLRQASADLFARQLRHIEQLATHSSTPPPAGAVRISPAAPMPVVTPSANKIERAPALVRKAEARKESVVISDGNASPEEIFSPEIVGEAPMIEAGRESISDSVLEKAESEGAATVSAAPAPASKPIYVTPRSRLKLWKKKLRSLAERVAPEPKTLSPSIFESVDRPIARPAPIEDTSRRQQANQIAERPKRRKIEWETPDDDIPSEAAVFEALASEGSVPMPPVAAPKEEVIETPTIKLPQASDEEVLPSTKPVESPVVAEASRAIETPVITEAPIVIEISAGVQAPHEREIRASEHNEKDISDARRKKTVASRVVPTPASRVRSKETQHEPSLVAPARAVRGLSGVDTIEQESTAAKSTRKRSGLGFKVNLADLEEITLVRPPSKRIRIDWDRAVPRPDLSSIQPRRQQSKTREISFSPTILGDAPDRTAEARGRSERMFSALSAPTSAEAYKRRSVILGSGLVATMALIVFGSGLVTETFQTPTAADAVTASASLPVATQQIAEPQVQAVSAAKQKSATASGSSSSEKLLPETIPISEKVSRPTIRSAANDVAGEIKTKAPPKPRAASSDEGNRSKELKTDDRKRSERSVTPAFKPATFTRPRIVKTAPH